MANSVHDISDEKFFLTKKNEITNFLLSYFGANSHQYSVIYRSSYESALYFLGESLQWDENSYLFLHQDSSQSVLGLRHYINHSKNIKIFDTQNLSLCTKSGNNNATNFVFIPLVEGFAGNVINISKLHLDTTSCKYKIIGDASLAFTINPINLSEINIDAVIVDFSKIFGFPNTAAIIVNKTFLFELKPSFPNNIIYAQVVGDNIIYSDEKRHDNTLQLNDLISIESGLELFQILGYEKMKSHTINLRNILYDQLSALTYSNDVSKCILYGNSRNTNILTFNILTNEKEYISDKYVVRKAYNKSILIEYGCHSFPFSCSHHIGINENDIYKFYSQKNNDNAVSDMVNRKPIGAIRVSIGWYNTIDDINHLIELIKEI